MTIRLVNLDAQQRRPRGDQCQTSQTIPDHLAASRRHLPPKKQSRHCHAMVPPLVVVLPVVVVPVPVVVSLPVVVVPVPVVVSLPVVGVPPVVVMPAPVVPIPVLVPVGMVVV